MYLRIKIEYLQLQCKTDIKKWQIRLFTFVFYPLKQHVVLHPPRQKGEAAIQMQTKKRQSGEPIKLTQVVQTSYLYKQSIIICTPSLFLSYYLASSLLLWNQNKKKKNTRGVVDLGLGFSPKRDVGPPLFYIYNKEVNSIRFIETLGASTRSVSQSSSIQSGLVMVETHKRKHAHKQKHINPILQNPEVGLVQSGFRLNLFQGFESNPQKIKVNSID